MHSASRNQTESRRTLQLRNLDLRSSFALDTGTYHTDPFGAGLVNAGADNAVEQFVAPGFSMFFPDDDFRCEVVDPWTMKYVCDKDNTRVPRSNLERSTQPMEDGDLPNVTLGVVTCNGHLPTHTGTSGDDVIVGTPLPDVIVGLGGNDEIKGKGGDDIICGGSGRDRIYGNGGDDVIFGDAGKDKMFGGGGRDTIWGGTGDDKLVGGGQKDLLIGQRGDDTLRGKVSNDLLLGGPHDDTIAGGDGDDVLKGQAGTDVCSEPSDTQYSCE